MISNEVRSLPDSAKVIQHSWGEVIRLVARLSIEEQAKVDRTVKMARKARVEFERAAYHVLDRGDRGEAIFGDRHPGVPKATAYLGANVGVVNSLRPSAVNSRSA